MKKKFTAPSLEQWAQLYGIASTVKQQKPWEQLWDNDLITIMLPDFKEPVSISVMGKGGECYGIGVYPGYRALAGYYRLLESSADDITNFPLGYQNCLTCYYGNRDKLAPEELAVIKSLQLKFRGNNNWIFFRAMEESFQPWILNAEQAGLMIEVLQNFSSAYQALADKKLVVDFENDETLLRYYSPEHKEWLNTAAPVPGIPEIRYTLKLDEVTLHRLQKAPQCNASFELDILYLSAPIQENADEKPYFPRLITWIDRKSGFSVDQKLVDKGMPVEDAFSEFLIRHITEQGRPDKIFVRDRYTLCYIESLCKQAGIPTAHGKGMPSTDEFAEGLFEHFNMND